MKRRSLPALLCALLPAWAAAATTVVISEATQFGLDRSPADGSFVLDVHGALWRLPADGGVARALTDGLGDD